MLGIRFKYLRFLYNRKMKLRKRTPISSTEKYVLEITKALIQNKDSDLYFSPNSGDRFIINENKSIYITLKDDKVDICNHTYRYLISVQAYVFDDINKFHDRFLEIRKKRMEKAMGRNINDSLHKLLHALNNQESLLEHIHDSRIQ